MKRSLLAVLCLTLALLFVLILSATLGVAQTIVPLHDPRPSPTPDGLGPTTAPVSPDTPSLPDLVVTSIQVAPEQPVINQPVTVRVTLKNQGSVDVPVFPTPQNFYTDLYVDPGVVPIQLFQDGQISWGIQAYWLPAGASYTLAATYVFTDVKVYALWAQVDTDDQVLEANENNNVFGPVQIEIGAPNTVLHQTHQDFQMGMASSMDISHPAGVLRRGIFIEPPVGPADPGVYTPDVMINDITGTISGGELLPTTVNQHMPVLVGDNAGTLYAAWVDGRNGGVYNRDIYFARSVDHGATWGTNVRVNDVAAANQVSPDMIYDGASQRLLAVWQDERNGNYDIYFAYSINGGTTWSASKKLNDDTGTAGQLNPSIAVGPRTSGGGQAVYVVWQDRRNRNDDIYIVRSYDGGNTWGANYFVGDDPNLSQQDQSNPSVGVDGFGQVVVCWEDWRNPTHPEIYAMWSRDEGATFGVDVPVTFPGGESYRIGPTMVVSTNVELEEQWDPEQEMTVTVPITFSSIHVAYAQQESSGNVDIYYAYAVYNYATGTGGCPWPSENDFCFNPPAKVNGFVIDSDYALPPDSGPTYPIGPAWRGEISLSMVPDGPLFWTGCLFGSTDVYSKGVFIAWSDAASYDTWRYEIQTRRVASPQGSPQGYVLCSDWGTGVLNDNVKIYALRNNLARYEEYQPAATRQANPSIYADPSSGVYVAWDDDRWDDPTHLGTVRNKDVFIAKMGIVNEAIYISAPIDGRAPSEWYILSWWGATEHSDDLLLQTRFGTASAGSPPQGDVAANGWTRWTGNPSSPYLGCNAGTGCFYDAPGRPIVAPDGKEWLDCPGPDCPPLYRYIQYKVTIKGTGSGWLNPYKTALSQVKIYYKGPGLVFLPIILRNH